MRAQDISINGVYAYHAPNAPKLHLQRAVVRNKPQGGRVTVAIDHPDGEQFGEAKAINTRELLGDWDSRPEVEDPGYSHVNKGPSDDSRFRFGKPMTYAESAAAEYGKVLMQRTMAARMTALGFRRLAEDYAGKGGEFASSWEERMDRRRDGLATLHTNVTSLGSDELEALLTMAEARENRVAWMVSDLDPESGIDAVAARVTLFDSGAHDAVTDFLDEPGPVERQLINGPLRVFRVVR
jgi:hypothetical protein